MPVSKSWAARRCKSGNHSSIGYTTFSRHIPCWDMGHAALAWDCKLAGEAYRGGRAPTL